MVETSRVALDGIDPVRLRAASDKATRELLSMRNSRGFWEGELSSSALSTATAVTAFALALKHGAVSESEIQKFKSKFGDGLRWLSDHQNPDGGWGDTTKSLSNISTTTLCWAAFGACDADQSFRDTLHRAEAWLTKAAGTIEPHQLARAIIVRYGKDRTFSVPILTMCALAGRLGSGREAWRDVIPLPFELAALPHQLFAALRLPVVSYALPALIAIGLARHVHAPSGNPCARGIRSLTLAKTMRVLEAIQPSNGGFLEATPLTSFVTMSLVSSGFSQHIVAQRGLKFLLKSQRTDGSWPIDTNLSTWCTTLAMDALPSSQLLNLSPQVSDWLLAQQYRLEHPYTHAAPGGWAWTDLPGGVPDADDTSGALVALAQICPDLDRSKHAEVRSAAEAAIQWLLKLQNKDGGIPTFCRGWGALPFDRSSADITAHAIRAWAMWHERVSPLIQSHLEHAISKAVRFLSHVQEPGGAFSPLWFGNQFVTDECNRTYGTARVLDGISALTFSQHFRTPEVRGLHQRCSEWLAAAQNEDGGWGGDRGVKSSVEETALAVEALARAAISDHEPAVRRGVNWLIERVESEVWRDVSPIGFYFAKLWYFERLYPLIFTVGALRAVEASEG